MISNDKEAYTHVQFDTNIVRNNLIAARF